MRYCSTKDPAHKVDFKTATLAGQPPDRGLYVPETIPRLGMDVISSMRAWSQEEIAVHVMAPYTRGSVPEKDLQTILSLALDFPFPLTQVEKGIYSLELFHGPTLAFKDVGARFMSRCLGYFAGQSDRTMTVLVATSGDTGGAVAHAFAGVENVRVVILFPSGKVSAFQESQLRLKAPNITTLEVTGNFDDCQRLVKEAFADSELERKRTLTSANSINIARWLPQQVYYFLAQARWPEANPPEVISVPSGNFGNLAAALLARLSGLPIRLLIAACNANDVFPRYLQTGTYQPLPSLHTLSNAMDVGDPSNFARILHFVGNDLTRLREFVSASSISDLDTEAAIRNVWRDRHYLLDPHGAVAYTSLMRFIDTHHAMCGYFLETAHPAKFTETVERLTRVRPALPDGFSQSVTTSGPRVLISTDYEEFKELLIDLTG